jgi:predicted transcriptional regulator of viral defense system
MTYTTSAASLPQGRKRLVTLLREAGDVISVGDAARALDLDRTRAAKALARWTAQGWLRRVAHGSYVPAALDTLESERVLEDPWVLVPALFSPAYVGGRTAAEHWDLTEQIFNDICVLTARPLRSRSQKHHGVEFTLKHIAESKIFGVKPVWRAHTKVSVSDVHRTIIDMLDDPEIGGGIRQVADCLASYLRRKDRDDDQLIAYAERLGNGAVFKRLGLLIEGDPGAERLMAACRKRLTKGNTKLDPALSCPRLVTRWRLWVPKFWSMSVRE